MRRAGGEAWISGCTPWLPLTPHIVQGSTALTRRDTTDLILQTVCTCVHASQGLSSPWGPAG